MSRGVDYMERPTSEQLADIHVFVVPPELWREHLRSAVNQIINETVSAGFVRVYPEMYIHNLREEIEAQLGDDVVPKEFVFLRSVGRALTRLKPKQERMLKVKTFLPPLAYSPEIYVLEATPEVRNIPFSGTSSEYSDRQYRSGYESYDSQRNSDFINHKPVIPPIRSGNSTSTQTGDDKPPSHRYDGYPVSPLTLNSATQTGNNTPVPTPRNRSPVPPIRQSPPRDFIAPPREEPSPQRSPTPPPVTHARDEPTDEHRAPTPVHRWTPTPVPKTPEESPQPPLNSNGHNANDIRDADDSPLPPLSASPPASAHRDDDVRHAPSRPRSQAEQGEFLPPVSATPPQSPAQNASPKRPANYTNKSSDDSGISEGADDRERRRLEELLRKEKEDEERKRAQQESGDAEGRRRQWEEDERRRKEEEERKRREDEWRKQQEENDGRNNQGDDDQEERRQQEEEEGSQRREEDDRRQDQDGFRSPPPPPPRERSVDTAAEKARILAELEKVREERKEMEKKREELVKKAKALQNRTSNRRNQARDVWKKKYFEEKKKTPPLEEHCNRLRQELDSLHRRIMSTLEGAKENRTMGGNKPSQQSNLKIQATKLQHDIEDYQRRVENVKMKLTSEMKLRNQAESELRALRAELTQKKINVTLTRSQQYNAALSGSQDFTTPRNDAALITPTT